MYESSKRGLLQCSCFRLILVENFLASKMDEAIKTTLLQKDERHPRSELHSHCIGIIQCTLCTHCVIILHFIISYWCCMFCIPDSFAGSLNNNRYLYHGNNYFSRNNDYGHSRTSQEIHKSYLLHEMRRYKSFLDNNMMVA